MMKTNMGRTVGGVFLGLLLGLCASLSAWAAPQLRMNAVTYDAQVFNKASTVTVPLRLTNDAAVASVQFDVEYPKAALSALGAFKVEAGVLSADHRLYSEEIPGGAADQRVG